MAKRTELDELTRYPADCLTRDKGCGNSLVGLGKKIIDCAKQFQIPHQTMH